MDVHWLSRSCWWSKSIQILAYHVWHDSIVIVSYAKFCQHHFIRIGKGASEMCIYRWWEKPLGLRENTPQIVFVGDRASMPCLAVNRRNHEKNLTKQIPSDIIDNASQSKQDSISYMRLTASDLAVILAKSWNYKQKWPQGLLAACFDRLGFPHIWSCQMVTSRPNLPLTTLRSGSKPASISRLVTNETDNRKYRVNTNPYLSNPKEILNPSCHQTVRRNDILGIHPSHTQDGIAQTKQLLSFDVAFCSPQFPDHI